MVYSQLNVKFKNHFKPINHIKFLSTFISSQFIRPIHGLQASGFQKIYEIAKPHDRSLLLLILLLLFEKTTHLLDFVIKTYLIFI